MLAFVHLYFVKYNVIAGDQLNSVLLGTIDDLCNNNGPCKTLFTDPHNERALFVLLYLDYYMRALLTLRHHGNISS